MKFSQCHPKEVGPPALELTIHHRTDSQSQKRSHTSFSNPPSPAAASEGKVEVYLIFRQTFFPAGSRVWGQDNEQQSRAARALRRSFISNLKTQARTKYISVFTSNPDSCLSQNERQYLSFCRPSTLPSFPSLSFCPVSRLVAPAQPERSKPPGFLFPFPGEVRATSFYSARHGAF